MKIIYHILTVLFWLTVTYSIFILIRTFSNNGLSDSLPVAAGQIVGGLIGAAMLPVIVYLVRYFVCKNVDK